MQCCISGDLVRFWLSQHVIIKWHQCLNDFFQEKYYFCLQYNLCLLFECYGKFIYFTYEIFVVTLHSDLTYDPDKLGRSLHKYQCPILAFNKQIRHVQFCLTVLSWYVCSSCVWRALSW